LLFLDVQHYFREEQGKDRMKEEEVDSEEEVIIPIITCQVIQRFFHICTEQHLVLQDIYLTKIN